MLESLTTAGGLRAAAERGDYALAAKQAAELMPDMIPQIEQYRIRMELYEEAVEAENWRQAIRALADARMAAIAADLPELEVVAQARLFQVVKHFQGRRD